MKKHFAMLIAIIIIITSLIFINVFGVEKDVEKHNYNLNNIDIYEDDIVSRYGQDVRLINVKKIDSNIAIDKIDDSLVEVVLEFKNNIDNHVIYVQKDFKVQTANGDIYLPILTNNYKSNYTIFLRENETKREYMYFDLPDSEFYYLKMNAKPYENNRIIAKWTFDEYDLED